MSDAAPPNDSPQGEVPSKNALKKAQKEKEKACFVQSFMFGLAANSTAGREEGCGKSA
jgi:hypothetical protein